MRNKWDDPFQMFSTYASTYRHHIVSYFSCTLLLVLSGQTELDRRPWDEALGLGLGELRIHLAEDTILPRSGKPLDLRQKDPNMFLNIKQHRSLLWWGQVMSWKEMGVESDRFKFEALLFNL